jgi:hypothetical protein
LGNYILAAHGKEEENAFMLLLFDSRIGVPPDAWWISIKAAGWSTVHDWLSSSYSNFIRIGLLGFCEFIAFLIGRWREERSKKERATVLKILGMAIHNKFVEAGLLAFIVIVMFNGALFVYNLEIAREIFIHNPPKVEIAWAQNQDGFEVPKGSGPLTFTPEYIRDNRQYVLDIEYPKTYSVPITLDVILEFPFSVTSWALSGGPSTQGTFSPIFSSLPLKMGGPNVHLVGQLYWSWALHVDGIQPGGHVRLVVTLNIAYGADYYKFVPHGPLDEYLHFRTTYSFGNQSASVEGYAPFEIGKDKNVTLGQWLSVPHNLNIKQALY